MLLNSFIFLLLALNIFFSKLYLLLGIFILLIALNIFCNSDIKKHLKSLKVLLFFYMTTFLVQIFYSQEGKVLYKFYNFYITEVGLMNFAINFLRIFNLVLVSWLVTSRKVFNGRLGRYQKIIETVIDLVPEVFTLFKKKMKIKYFLRNILRKIKIKYEV